MMELLDILKVDVPKEIAESSQEIITQHLQEQIAESTKDGVSKEQIAQFLVVLIPACTVEPRITTAPVGTDNEISFYELDFADQFDLLKAIMDYAEWSKESIVDRKSFPE
jgi:hypothetical protein